MGLILRKQLLILLAKQKYYEKSSKIAPITLDYPEYIALINHQWDLSTILPNLPSQSALKDFAVDLVPCMICYHLFLMIIDMDKSQIVVHDKFSFTEAYKLFVTQSLRHLPIVNEDYNVVGMITRHDLLQHHNH